MEFIVTQKIPELDMDVDVCICMYACMYVCMSNKFEGRLEIL